MWSQKQENVQHRQSNVNRFLDFFTLLAFIFHNLSLLPHFQTDQASHRVSPQNMHLRDVFWLKFPEIHEMLGVFLNFVWDRSLYFFKRSLGIISILTPQKVFIRRLLWQHLRKGKHLIFQKPRLVLLWKLAELFFGNFVKVYVLGRKDFILFLDQSFVFSEEFPGYLFSLFQQFFSWD